MKNRINIFTLIFLMTILFISCTHVSEETYGKIQFNFRFAVNGYSPRPDTILYTNAAGNPYMISGVQYFISNVTLHKTDGSAFQLTKDGCSKYIDIDIPTTLSWLASDAIPAGKYSSVSFTFGIKSSQNKSNMFVNPPQSNMWWPDMLGGGYHYLKLDGKWLPPSQTIGIPFNIHLGIGRSVDAITGDTTFVDNSFDVNLGFSTMSVHNETHNLNIIMNIDSWFTTPNIYDFNVDGGAIMESQILLQKIKENGYDVFSAQVVN